MTEKVRETRETRGKMIKLSLFLRVKVVSVIPKTLGVLPAIRINLRGGQCNLLYTII